MNDVLVTGVFECLYVSFLNKCIKYFDVDYYDCVDELCREFERKFVLV